MQPPAQVALRGSNGLDEPYTPSAACAQLQGFLCSSRLEISSRNWLVGNSILSTYPQPVENWQRSLDVDGLGVEMLKSRMEGGKPSLIEFWNLEAGGDTYLPGTPVYGVLSSRSSDDESRR